MLLEHLRARASDGSLLAVLQGLYPDEWRHFCERTGVRFTTTIDALAVDDEVQVRVWASNRGQTLCRTVCGMMSYQDAIAMQARLEGGSADLAASRFEFVVSCQMYGEQKRAGDPKADDVDLLLSLHEGLRVAYVDRTPANAMSGGEASMRAIRLCGAAMRPQMRASTLKGWIRCIRAH